MVRLLQIIVSLTLVAWVLTTIDLTDVGDHFAHTRFDILALAIPLIIADRWLMSAKWNLLLKAHDVQLSQWHCYRIYAISNFVGLFLPPTIGVDVSRTTLASYEGLPLPAIASSIVVERLLGFAALVFMTVAGALALLLFYGYVNIDISSLLKFAIIAMSSFFAVVFISFTQIAQHYVFIILERLSKWGKLLGKVSKILRKTYSAYLEYKNKRLTLITFFILSCIEGFLIITTAYVASLSLNLEVNFIYFAASISVVIFLIRMPISIGGFGVYEKGIQFFLLQVGVSESLGLATGILFHLICLLALLPGGLIMAFYRKPALPNRQY